MGFCYYDRMGWQDEALCKTLPNAMFFPNTDSDVTDKQLWDAHKSCRDCPVNYECLAEALNGEYEFGLFCIPERVRKRFRTKAPVDLYKTMLETFKTIDIIAPAFDKRGKLLRKRCLRCNRVTRGFAKDTSNWGGRSHICVSCHIQITNNKQADKLLDREKPSKSMPDFDNHGQLVSKRCTKCWERKVASEFSKRPQGIGGKTSWCKLCTRKNLEQWQARQNK